MRGMRNCPNRRPASWKQAGVPALAKNRRSQDMAPRCIGRAISSSRSSSTGRRFAVTGIGEDYHRHCVAMLVEAEAAQEAIDRIRAVPQGVVRIACPSAALNFQVGTMIARFLVAHPKVEVRLESTNRRVDAIREGFDIAIRVRFPPLDESELVMKVLAESTQRLVAAPQVLAGIGRPLVPADAGTLPSLSWGGPHQNHEWRLNGRGGAEAVIRHQPRFVTEDMVPLRHAALERVGIVQMPSMVVSDDIKAGRLVDVLPDWAPRAGIVHAVFPSRLNMHALIRTADRRR